MAWTNTLRTDTPDGDVDNPAQADDEIRRSKAAPIERLNVDHYFEAEDSNGDAASNQYDGPDCGMHRQVSFNADNTPSSVPADEGVAHAKADADSGKLEFAYTDEDEDTVQLTKDGKINLSATTVPDDSINDDAIQLQNDAYLKSANAADDGEVDLIKAGTDGDDNDVPIIPIGAQLSADTAPTEDKDIPNKKYVDDTVHFGAPVTVDSDSNTLAFDEVYQAETSGHVIGHSEGAAGTELSGYVDTVSNPTTLHDKARCGTGGEERSVHLYVPKDYYFKVAGGSGSKWVRWIPIGSGDCVKQA